MTPVNVVWWVLFFIAGVGVQQALPGIDALVIALLLALQERRPLQLLSVTVGFILVQEGVGTLDFGASLLWSFLVVSLFFIGRWLFETENFLFMFMISGCIGAGHCGVLWLMARLQYTTVNMTDLLDESILQALFIPFAWKFAMFARRWVVPHENTA
ncbi:MAG: hypothetical protein RR014_04525 [Bilophila sp.]